MNGNKPALHTALSPSMLHLYDANNTIVVIIDVLRATSTIATALYNGASYIVPVETVARCIELGREPGTVTAGERDGKIAEGLQYGNSPFEYPRKFIENKILILTTTNGFYIWRLKKVQKILLLVLSLIYQRWSPTSLHKTKM